jgi:hypothetical protein
MMSKKIVFISLTAILISSCSPATQGQVNSNVNHSILPFQTKKGVECLIYNSGNKAGVSCNWDKYNKLIEQCLEEHENKYPDFPDLKDRCESNIINKANK